MPPFWLLPALGSQALLAAVQITDRFLLKQPRQRPIIYAFLVGVSGLINLVVAPPCLIFGCLVFPGFFGFFENIAAGTVFFLALISFYAAMQKGEASRVIPAVGGLTSVFVFLLASIFLREQLLFVHYIALLFIFFGYVAITKTEKDIRSVVAIFSHRHVATASFLFAVSTVLAKNIYTSQPFVSAFLWIGYTTGVAALVPLLWGASRRDIVLSIQGATGGNRKLFVANRIGGALSGILFNYALKLGPTALVQASQGAQYIFVLLISSSLSLFRPEILREKLSTAIFLQKFVATTAFVIGLTLIALGG